MQIYAAIGRKMRRAFGFPQQQQSYGMRQEVQESSYSMHKEAAWDSKDDYHYHSNHISGVPIVPSLLLDSQFIKRNSMFDGRQVLQLHGGSWRAENTNQYRWSGQKLLPEFSLGAGGAMNFNTALMELENAEYEASFQEVHRLPATMRVQETRYERRIWGDCDEDHGLQYCHGFDDNVRCKRNGVWKAEWISKGA